MVGDRVVGARVVRAGIEGAGAAVFVVEGASFLGAEMVGNRIVGARDVGADVEIFVMAFCWCRGSQRGRSWCGR